MVTVVDTEIAAAIQRSAGDDEAKMVPEFEPLYQCRHPGREWLVRFGTRAGATRSWTRFTLPLGATSRIGEEYQFGVFGGDCRVRPDPSGYASRSWLSQ